MFLSGQLILSSFLLADKSVLNLQKPLEATITDPLDQPLNLSLRETGKNRVLGFPLERLSVLPLSLGTCFQSSYYRAHHFHAKSTHLQPQHKATVASVSAASPPAHCSLMCHWGFGAAGLLATCLHYCLSSLQKNPGWSFRCRAPWMEKFFPIFLKSFLNYSLS